MADTIIMTTLTSEELKNLIVDSVSIELKKQFELKEKPDNSDKFFTRKQAASTLKISIPTLLEYAKKGKINAHRIGRRILFRQSDINQALKKIDFDYTKPGSHD